MSFQDDYEAAKLEEQRAKDAVNEARRNQKTVLRRRAATRATTVLTVRPRTYRTSRQAVHAVTAYVYSRRVPRCTAVARIESTNPARKGGVFVCEQPSSCPWPCLGNDGSTDRRSVIYRAI